MKVAFFYLLLILSGSLNAQISSAVTEHVVTEDMRWRVMNYTEPDSVLQFKKLEIGVALTSTEQSFIQNFLRKSRVAKQYKLNPFLEWEVDVEATFVHLASGTKIKVDGFYYRDYLRDTVQNDWVEQHTDFPFRIRFCPTLTGEWSYTLSVSIREKEAYTSDDQFFNVVESDGHGFVSVHNNKRNLSLDDRIIMPIGQNFIAPVNGVDSYFVKPEETHKAARVDDWLSYHKDVQDYQQLGGRFIRTVQTAWSSLIEFEEKGNYYNRLHYAWEQDKLIEFCDSTGMMMNFNFMFQEPLMSFGQYHTTIWDFDHYTINPENNTHSRNENDAYLPYCYNDNGDEEPHNMFLDEDDLRYHEQRMRYYISRYGYSTSIMVFELLSEPMHLDQFYPNGSFEMKDDEHGRIVRKAMYNYNSRISNYIKNTMGHTDHLIGLHAFDNHIFWQDTVAQKIWDESCGIPTIDVIGFSTYKGEPARLLITKHGRGTSDDDDENSYFHSVSRFTERYGKPVMHFEQGCSSDAVSSNEASNFVPHNLDMRTIGFTGCAGFYPWEGYIHDGPRDQRMAWYGTIVGERWMNSDTVIRVLQEGNGNWIQGRQAEKSRRFGSQKTKETQYVISEDRKNAAGYVLNRTYNAYTMAITSDLQKKVYYPGTDFGEVQSINWKEGNKPLYVSDLQPEKEYTITWYDYNGSVISEEIASTKKNGELRLRFPELTVEPGEHLRPLVWYKVSINK